MRTPPPSHQRRRSLPLQVRRLRFEPLEDRRLLAAGALDPTFGIGGKVTTELFRGDLTFEGASAIAITTTGKIIAAGTGGFIVQYNSDGTIDTTFGQQGLAAFEGTASAVTLQADGKIVVVGSVQVVVGPLGFGGQFDYSVARYLPNGTLDTSFNVDGNLTIAFGPSDDGASDVVVQSDGKIIVAGIFETTTANNPPTNIGLARLNADGSFDASFDGDGKAITVFGAEKDSCTGVKLQADGKIVIVGTTLTGSNYDYVLARYNTNGSLDTSFDGDGKVTTAFGSNSELVYDIAIDSSNRLIVAGWTTVGGNPDFALARYNTNGSLDTSFDGDGKATTAIGTGDDRGFALAIQSDGKIVVAGQSSNGSNVDVALARYNTDGSLDTSFDGDGKQTTDFASGTEGAQALLLQSDGRIVVAGARTPNYDLALARYLGNGSLDTSFDGDGKLITDLHTSHDSGQSVALQSDGKIVVVAGGYDNDDYVVTRYNANGTLDTSFGGVGWVVTPYSSMHDEARAVAVQSDGKVVVTGFFSGTFGYDFGTVRYNADGSLDTSFSGDGKMSTFFGTQSDRAYGLVLQNDGKIVVAGTSAPVGTGSTDFAAARYNTNGSLDTSFDTDGGVLTSFGASTIGIAYSVAVQANGKIVVAGTALIGIQTLFALVRYNADGSLDTTFDGDGIVTTAFGSHLGDEDYRNIGLVLQSDGKIVVAGPTTNGTNIDFALARYNVNGSLDTSFDGDGKLTTPVGPSDDFAHSIVLQSDGKIVVAGQSDNGTNFDFALVRYNADGSLDTSFDGDGKLITAFGPADDGANSLVLQADGKFVLAGYTYNGSHYDTALARYEGDASSVPTLLGDYNLDGAVDAADYIVWRKTLGTTGVPAYSGADGDGDGTIDQDDLNVWRAHFGQSAVPALLGDYNQDNKVDAGDYIVWRKTLGTAGVPPYSGADGDGDGTIDQDDHGVWRANFGQVLPPSGTGSGQLAAVNLGHVAESLRDSVVSDTADSERLPHVAAPLRDADWSDGRRFRAESRSTLTLTLSQRERGLQDDALVAWVGSRDLGREEDACDSRVELGNGQDCPSYEGAIDDEWDTLDVAFAALAGGI
jgi:uncharacterized delta-60 repeat protein